MKDPPRGINVVVALVTSNIATIIISFHSKNHDGICIVVVEDLGYTYFILYEYVLYGMGHDLIILSRKWQTKFGNNFPFERFSSIPDLTTFCSGKGTTDFDSILNDRPTREKMKNHTKPLLILNSQLHLNLLSYIVKQSGI